MSNFNCDEFFVINDEDDKINYVYNRISSFESNPDYESIDEVLKSANMEVLQKLSITEMLSFLTAPYSLSNHLKEYLPLLDRINQELKARRESETYIKTLVQGFDKKSQGRLVFK
jgi:hypothetical protein